MDWRLPSTRTRTLPFLRFITNPASPSWPALRWTKARYPTPCTRPCTRISAALLAPAAFISHTDVECGCPPAGDLDWTGRRRHAADRSGPAGEANGRGDWI